MELKDILEFLKKRPQLLIPLGAIRNSRAAQCSADFRKRNPSLVGSLHSLHHRADFRLQLSLLLFIHLCNTLSKARKL